MKTEKRLIAASILSADFSCLAKEIRGVEQAAGDWIHIDVMDGHFVPNLTIGPPVVKSIRNISKLPFDVHLMIDKPIRYLEAFKKAGADYLTVHVEACGKDGIRRTLAEIKNLGTKTGLSVKPKTKVQTLEPYLDLLDLALVMTVEPGFGGQAFMPEMLKKVEWLSQRFKGFISVDGGIQLETARLCARKGARVFVAGSSIFSERNRRRYISKLRRAVSVSCP